MLVLKLMLNKLSGGSSKVRRAQGNVNVGMACEYFGNLFGNRSQNKNCRQSEFKKRLDYGKASYSSFQNILSQCLKIFSGEIKIQKRMI